MHASLPSAVLALLFCGGCRAPATPAKVAFERQMTGQLGLALEAKNLVARSAEEWRAFCRPNAPGVEDALRDFDWSANMLIAVALGSRPSGGYAVEIESVEQDGARWVVHARETRPTPGSLQTQMVTSPFDCVSTRRFDGNVMFRFE
ncbi:MAG TPA: protease complex subunit PrcB family protein [Planctomycetota bacterium]|nr:protease complex subunit PrcB family protein [Planctomycetota bacterium]